MQRVKVKCRPEDFQVHEVTELQPSTTGDYAFYLLTKRGLSTLEVVQAVCKRWHIRREHISFGGLKDKHALTSQYVTIYRGPRRTLRQTNFELKYLGQLERPYSSEDVKENRFHIVVRNLEPSAAEVVQEAIGAIERWGLPNYFDDQRFGSVGESGEFVARAWIERDYERALWLAIADANPNDRSEVRNEKRMLRRYWRNWQLCLRYVKTDVARRCIEYLSKHPRDFKRALVQIPHDLRSLYLAAYQSYLWNLVLINLLRELLPPESLLEFEGKCHTFVFFRELPAEAQGKLQDLELPLPSARIKLEEGPIKELVDRTLEAEGLTLKQIKLRYPRDTFFTKGWRRALFPVSNLEFQFDDDELYEGMKKLTLGCVLPRGCYGTLIVKRIQAELAAVGSGRR